MKAKTTKPKPGQQVHVFYDTYLGFSHSSLTEIWKEQTGRTYLKPHELAVFMNKSWKGIKILAPGNVLLYARSTSAPFTVEDLKKLPSVFGGTRLQLSGALETGMEAHFASTFGKHMARLKVVKVG